MASAAHTHRAGSGRLFEPCQVVVALLVVGQFDAVVVAAAQRHRERDVQRVGAELIGNALIEHLAAVAVANAVGDDVQQNAGDDCWLVLVVLGEDHGNVRPVGPVRQACALAHLAVVVFCREGKGVIDPVGIPVEHRRGFVLGTQCPSGV